MREIKFRAWDNDREEMRVVSEMDFSDWWVSCKPNNEEEFKQSMSNPLLLGERNSFKNENTDRHILMQYTGLRDTNGVEVYEDDIVSLVKLEHDEFGYNEPVSVPDNLPEEYGRVIFDEGEGIYTLEGYEPNNLTSYKYTVVGNIHENSELLEEEYDWLVDSLECGCCSCCGCSCWMYDEIEEEEEE